MKIGSLFDGSGGFPLAGYMCGIEPVWGSEIEPYPIAVTRSRFPNMRHLGSVTDIKGDEIEPVDIITFGSPCQDLSVAGKRAGLKHTENGDDETTRSGLFMEAVRIIKEMRNATNGEYPRYAIWENVPGAFSSNKGLDFRVVLEELIRVAEPTAVMPLVPNGGWAYADVYCGNGWSLAYRVLDAQYWGVPQRRRRIYLVADFGGQRAGKILFEREGLRGYFAKSGTQGETVTGNAENSVGTADCGECEAYGVTTKGNGDAFVSTERHTAVSCGGGQAGQGYPCALVPDTPAVMTPITLEPGIAAREGGHIYEGVCGTLRANAGDNQMAIAYSNLVLDDQGGSQISVRTDGKTPTLRAEMHGNIPCVFDTDSIPYTLKIRSGCEGGGKGALVQEDIRVTLATNSDQHLFQPVSIENHPADSRVNIDDSGKVQTLTSRMGTGGGNVPMVMEPTPFCKSARPRSADDATTWKDGIVANTLNTFDLGEVRCNELVVEQSPACCLQGNCIDRRPEVAYSMKSISRSGKPLTEQANPICASDYKDPDIVAYPPNGVRYIVRRLTPTECARLQGFPDKWGHLDTKTELTDEEYAFWLNVRNIHASINNRATKEYTKEQMLTWYNKLHTDSSEYKMWGNGLALPCALYVMQGIADSLNGGNSNA